MATPQSPNTTIYADTDGSPIVVSAANPLPVSATVNVTTGSVTPVTLVDGSGTITLGGTSQQIFAANGSRRYLLIQNVSDTDAWVNFGGAAVASQPSIKIVAGGYYEPLIPSGASVNIIGATTGKAFVAKQG